MELTRLLLAYGSRRPRVLVASVPGGAEVRRCAERVLLARGWARADSPADADAVLACGTPGPELREQLERVWDQLPGPRARSVVVRPADVEPALDRVRAELGDLARQREDARARTRHDDDAPAGADHQDAEQGDGADGSADDDMGGMDHDMGGMGMPGGLGMASTAPDRDGLQLDVLHVQLGPVLPCWPAGLVADVELQGDVATAVHLRALDPEQPRDVDQDDVVRLDRAAALLELAGATRASRDARRLRDGGAGRRALSRLHDEVSGDRVLRWSLRGLPALGAHDDLWAQLLGLLAPVPGDRSAEQGPVEQEAAEGVLVGLELTALRLVLAAAPPGLLPQPEPAGA